jgi:hypothetical protein
MDIDSKKQAEGDAVSYTQPSPIFILFNPWCKGKKLSSQANSLDQYHISNKKT